MDYVFVPLNGCRLPTDSRQTRHSLNRAQSTCCKHRDNCRKKKGLTGVRGHGDRMACCLHMYMCVCVHFQTLPGQSITEGLINGNHIPESSWVSGDNWESRLTLNPGGFFFSPSVSVTHSCLLRHTFRSFANRFFLHSCVSLLTSVCLSLTFQTSISRAFILEVTILTSNH